MADSIGSAWIAAGASLAVSLVSLGAAGWANRRADRAQREQAAVAQDLERLKSRLTDEADAAKAKRDYEYEARKRLYAELYPLSFHLHEAAIGAHNRIKNLARATRGGWLAAGKDNWLTGVDPYYFTAVLYSFIAPLAVYELMSRKLTLLDLQLDLDLHREHFIARAAYQALRADFDLIDPRYPPIVFGPAGQSYAPPEVRPAILPPEREQRWAWRQGLYSGQISQAVDAMLTTTGTTTRVMRYAEFAKALGGTDLRAEADPAGAEGAMKRALQPMVELFRDFHPARRPVTWRILLAQGACYRAIAAAATPGGHAGSESILRAARYAGSRDRAEFDWIGDAASVPPALLNWVDLRSEQDAALAAADLHIEGVFADFASRYAPPPP